MGNGRFTERPEGGGHPPINLSLPRSHDTAMRLLKDLDEGRRDSKDLSANQRRAVLMVILGKKTSAQLGAMFGVSSETIRRDVRKIQAKVGSEVMEWGIKEVVGDLALAKERCVAEASGQGDPGLVWTIHKEYAKLLLDLGVIEKRNEQEGFELTIRGVGDRYEAAVQAISGKLDPLVSGVQPPRLPLKDRGLVENLVTSQDVVAKKRIDPSAYPELEPPG